MENIKQCLIAAAIMMVAVNSPAIAEEEATPSGKEVVVVEESTSGISGERLIYETVNDTRTSYSDNEINDVSTFTVTDGTISSLSSR